MSNKITYAKKSDVKALEDFIITANGTTDDDGNISVTDVSATFEEIKAAYDAGKNVKLLGVLDEIVNGIVPLVQVSDETLVFSVTNESTNITIGCTVDNNWYGGVVEFALADLADRVVTKNYITSVIDETAPGEIPTSKAVIEYVAKKSEDLKLRDERLKYYGDPNIVPSDESLFEFTLEGDTVAVSIRGNIGGFITVPYCCDINGRKYDVGKIRDNAFQDCTNLTSITIPDSVTSIGAVAFGNCSGLTNITIPDSVTSIGIYAFANCSSLTNITIPYGITSISDKAFLDCTNLTRIDIPDSVTSIGDTAFYNCTSLTNITIPDSVTSIGDYAFNNYQNLTINCAEGSVADQYAQENGIAVEYTNEVTKQFVLDNGGKVNVITSITDTTLILEDMQDAQLGEVSDLILSMPDEVSTTYNSAFSFTSGDSATVLTYSATPIIWRGDDCDSEGAFVPEVNTMYEVSVKYVNTNPQTQEPVIVARVGVI